MDTRVLVIQHEPACPPARFGDWLLAEGCELDVVPAWREALPALKGYDGLLVLGGAMDADDDEAWPHLASTRELIAQAAREGVPTLGLCLGLQLAALALGGRLARLSVPQVGLLPIGWSCDVLIDPLLARIAGDVRAVHWNQDVVEVPDNADVLARGPRLPEGPGAVQAARLAPTVWGLQFHPEADTGVVAEWVRHDPPGERSFARQAGTDGSTILTEVTAAHDELGEAWRPLAEAFARMVQGRAGARQL